MDRPHGLSWPLERVDFSVGYVRFIISEQQQKERDVAFFSRVRKSHFFLISPRILSSPKERFLKLSGRKPYNEEMKTVFGPDRIHCPAEGRVHLCCFFYVSPCEVVNYKARFLRGLTIKKTYHISLDLDSTCPLLSALVCF